jgi:filamentous hemagglutinin
MNKTRYCIIFNSARARCMVVAETAARGSGGCGQAKTSGARSATWALCCGLMWGLASAQAQVVPDPSAPSAQRPTVLTAPNQVLLVNIQAPVSAAGVSRNTYRQFDVPKQGLILNNSPTNVATQLGGWVQGNPWLATGAPARVILNEVNANQASLLQGHVEVAGSRAQVVIANPAGVTCNGCGFINASHATLSTGTPLWSAAGALEGYRVHGGLVTVTGAGLDARLADYTHLLARAVHIQAGVWAQQLNVMAGANDISVNPASGLHTAVGHTRAGANTAPTFAIDVAELGGLYAGHITLVGTEAGVGVRNAGQLYASAGQVIVTAAGQLQNAGHIASTGHTQLNAQAGLQNTGTVYAQGNTTFTTQGHIDNSGTLAAAGHTALAATGPTSRISQSAAGVWAAGVQADGRLGDHGYLSAQATHSVNLAGKSWSGGDQTLSAQALNLAGSQLSARNLQLNASSADVDLQGANVAVGQTLTVYAQHTLRTDQASIGAQQIQLSARALSNEQGDIVQTGAGPWVLNVAELLNNTQGRLASNGHATFNLGALTNTGGTIEATGPTPVDLTLNVQGQVDNSAGGQILAIGQARLSADRLSNHQGLLAAGGALSVNAAQLDNQAGTLASAQDSVILSVMNEALNNTAGRIEAAKTVNVSALGFLNVDGTVAGQSLLLDTHRQAFNNTRGQLLARGTAATDTLNLQTGAFNNTAGLLQATGGLTLNTHGQTLTNTLTQTDSGTRLGIVGQTSVALNTGDFNNQGGFVGSGGHASLTGTNLDSGHIQALGDLHITLSDTLNNTESLLRSGQALTVSARTLANTQTQGNQQGLEGNTIHLSAAQIQNHQGAIRATQTATLLSADHIDNSQGLIAAGTTLRLQDPMTNPANLATLAITNTSGTLWAGHNLWVNSASLSGNGALLSQGDLSVQLAQSYAHTATGQLAAVGNARLHTQGSLTNPAAATLSAGGRLDLQATTLTNRGLLDATTTHLTAQTLHNLGPGRIYGDHVALSVGSLLQTSDDGVAPVMAARHTLNIGATTLDNRDQALIFSAGSLAVGGQLDARLQASGSATTLTNASATLEALGSMSLSAEQLLNTNPHFSTRLTTLPTQQLMEYQGSGSPYRYAQGTPGVFIFNDESDHLQTPERFFERWTAYDFTRHTTQTEVQASTPGQILAGAAMHLQATQLINDTSHIMAGASLSANVASLSNVEPSGQRTQTDTGIATLFWRDHRSGLDTTGSSVAAYEPAATVQAIALAPALYQQHTAPSGSGTTLAALATPTRAAPALASAPLATPSALVQLTPITQVVALASSGPATVVRSGGLPTTVPSSSLWRTTPLSTSRYLVETDPAFTQYRQWLSSDYLLSALSLDPAALQKRLGDGYYEQQLIRQQVGQLTGRRFLEGHADDQAQYQALLSAGATYAQAHQLIPGVALAPEQMAQLTSDIVWLVEQAITVPARNGQPATTVKALVPQLYVRVQDADLQAGGALLSGHSLRLQSSGDLTNAGTIAGRTVATLTAQNLHHLGGRISAQDLAIGTRGDLNSQASLVASDQLSLLAGRDLNVGSTTQTSQSVQGNRVGLNRVAGLYVTGGSATLLAQAGRDVNLVGAAVFNTGSGNNSQSSQTTLVAGRNLNLGSVQTSTQQHTQWDSNNQRTEATSTEVGTVLQTEGNLSLQAGQDLLARAAQLTSTQGSLEATAGRDLQLNAGQAEHTVHQTQQHTGRSSSLARKLYRFEDRLAQTSAQSSILSASQVQLQAGRDLSVVGSQVLSDTATSLSAQRDLTLNGAVQSLQQSQLQDQRKSGLFSGGSLGVTWGTQQQRTDQTTTQISSAPSIVGSTQGSVSLSAGQAYDQTGGEVLAPNGSIRIQGQSVDIQAAPEQSQTQLNTRFQQSGLTLAVTSPVITALQTMQHQVQAVQATRDPRMSLLGAANVGMAAQSGYQALQDDPGRAGGINLALSVGASQNQASTQTSSRSTQAARLVAGQDIDINSQTNIRIEGTQLQAGRSLSLQAQDDITLQASQHTSEQRSRNSSASGSLGVSFGTSGLGVTVSASGGKGKANGDELHWAPTTLVAGQGIRLQSGGDTTLRGASVQAPQIQAEVGGDLKMESLQDSQTYRSKQQSIGGSLTMGAGVSGSVSASQAKVNSSWTSVAQQSGLQAGVGGVQVNVRGSTELKGAAITSSEAAVQDNRNTFSSAGGLTGADLQNQAQYSAQAVGVSLSSTSSSNGKSQLGGNAGVGQDSGQASSTTRWGISGVAGDQAARTGDQATGIKTIFNAEQVQRDIQAQVAITQEFSQAAGQRLKGYTEAKQADLQKQLKAETDPQVQADLQAQIKELALQARVMNVLIGAVTGLGTSALTKEGLSAAADEMRRITIEDSGRFAGITDGQTTLTNLTGVSEGVRADGVKTAGTRMDLDLLCGGDNKRCVTNADGSLKLNGQGLVQFDIDKADSKTLAEFLETEEGKKLQGPTGGIQGSKGLLFGIPYAPSSWQDKLLETFGGTHDVIGGQAAGLYDEQGNIKRGMSNLERGAYDFAVSPAAILPSTPFAMAKLLPPEVWQAIAILLRAGK